MRHRGDPEAETTTFFLVRSRNSLITRRARLTRRPESHTSTSVAPHGLSWAAWAASSAAYGQLGCMLRGINRQ